MRLQKMRAHTVSMSESVPAIIADWPAPPQVRALTTTRVGGVSAAAYGALNLAMHVGDDPQAVVQNRGLLHAALALPTEPVWLEQVHGTRVIDAGAPSGDLVADGSFATRPGVVCAVLTADCLPVFLCSRKADRVAVVHAGWRGLVSGVIERGIDSLQTSPEELLAWLGPAIGPRAFEVGEEVRDAFMAQDARAEVAFVSARKGHWLADLYQLATLRLRARGVQAVHGGGFCTMSDATRFFSFRRERVCGRMASLIWLEPTC